jgi:2-methylcitrate dehydratase PrpD
MAAVAEAMARKGLSASDVVSVHARVHPDSAGVVCAAGRDLVAPQSPYAAKFSLPWSVAAMVVDGAVTTSTYTESGIRRLEVASLARSVTWELLEDPGTVAADAPGDVTLMLLDGGIVQGHVDRSPGGGSAPLSREALMAKLAGNLGGPTPDLVDVVEHLADQPDLGTLFRLAAEAVSRSARAMPTPTEAAR